MLRSFTGDLMASVFRGPETEGGSDDSGTIESNLDVGGGDDTGGTDAGGGTDSGENNEGQPLTVREQLKKAIAETSEPQAKPKKDRDPKTGRFGERQAKGQEAAPVAPEGEQPVAAAPVVEPPASLPKELKAAWDKAPPEIQQPFLKREQDMAKGVEELKNRYTLIDQAIAPHTDALRQMNATPGDAVNRMFLWFKALAGSPQESFPALAKSMGIDWAKLNAPVGGQQAQPVEGAPGAAPEIPEPVKQYVGTLEKQVKELNQVVQQIYGGFTGIQNNLNTQNEARTRENLGIWSKDKPYFEEVRQDMAKLIETGVVPLNNGQVDLDTAYERAIYFNPEVRAKVLAEQQQANQQVQQKTQQAATTAQQSQVTKARKAAVSLPVSSPSEAGKAPLKKKPGEKSSVRDSLKAAMAELRDQ